ncbi:uncharacterized protein BJ171DRAFT_293393 [Polychytrium aggregatum]|uniref:uncharacterized protein n=1 Tax=Polychytrium aggregatum TaxID=110093 RepID=UPI0022FF013C|nr:uncharacterized protein BJ171DRAFT_293393 [Polychytrium aggregatum]KAI9207225.1 hypothetical protein BJ171DRAFT_293393 [Polychytrium aggregatum]
MSRPSVATKLSSSAPTATLTPPTPAPASKASSKHRSKPRPISSDPQLLPATDASSPMSPSSPLPSKSAKSRLHRHSLSTIDLNKRTLTNMPTDNGAVQNPSRPRRPSGKLSKSTDKLHHSPLMMSPHRGVKENANPATPPRRHSDPTVHRRDKEFELPRYEPSRFLTSASLNLSSIYTRVGEWNRDSGSTPPAEAYQGYVVLTNKSPSRIPVPILKQRPTSAPDDRSQASATAASGSAQTAAYPEFDSALAAALGSTFPDPPALVVGAPLYPIDSCDGIDGAAAVSSSNRVIETPPALASLHANFLQGAASSSASPTGQPASSKSRAAGQSAAGQSAAGQGASGSSKIPTNGKRPSTVPAVPARPTPSPTTVSVSNRRPSPKPSLASLPGATPKAATLPRAAKTSRMSPSHSPSPQPPSSPGQPYPAGTVRAYGKPKSPQPQPQIDTAPRANTIDPPPRPQQSSQSPTSTVSPVSATVPPPIATAAEPSRPVPSESLPAVKKVRFFEWVDVGFTHSPDDYDRNPIACEPLTRSGALEVIQMRMEMRQTTERLYRAQRNQVLAAGTPGSPKITSPMSPRRISRDEDEWDGHWNDENDFVDDDDDEEEGSVQRLVGRLRRQRERKRNEQIREERRDSMNLQQAKASARQINDNMKTQMMGILESAPSPTTAVGSTSESLPAVRSPIMHASSPPLAALSPRTPQDTIVVNLSSTTVVVEREKAPGQRVDASLRLSPIDTSKSVIESLTMQLQATTISSASSPVMPTIVEEASEHAEQPAEQNDGSLDGSIDSFEPDASTVSTTSSSPSSDEESRNNIFAQRIFAASPTPDFTPRDTSTRPLSSSDEDDEDDQEPDDASSLSSYTSMVFKSSTESSSADGPVGIPTVGADDEEPFRGRSRRRSDTDGVSLRYQQKYGQSDVYHQPPPIQGWLQEVVITKGRSLSWSGRASACR